METRVFLQCFMSLHNGRREQHWEMSSLFCKKFHLNLLSATLHYVRRETDFKSDKFLLDSTMGFGNLHTFKCLFLVYLCTKMFANWSWKSKVFQNWDRLYKIAIEFWNSTFLQVSKKLLTNNTRPKNISWNYI